MLNLTLCVFYCDLQQLLIFFDINIVTLVNRRNTVSGRRKKYTWIILLPSQRRLKFSRKVGNDSNKQLCKHEKTSPPELRNHPTPGWRLNWSREQGHQETLPPCFCCGMFLICILEYAHSRTLEPHLQTGNANGCRQTHCSARLDVLPEEISRPVISFLQVSWYRNHVRVLRIDRYVEH